MEEDLKLLEEMKNNCLTKRDYIDEKAERKAQAIENLINKYKKQEEQIKEYKNNTWGNDLATAQASGMFAIMESLKRKCKEQEKIIDLMASFIEVAELDEDIAKTYCLNEACTEINEFTCKKCIKDYFKKKVKEAK